MKNDKSDQGKPACCAPGDLSACVVEITEAKNKTDAKVKPPKKTPKTDEKENGEKA